MKRILAIVAVLALLFALVLVFMPRTQPETDSPNAPRPAARMQSVQRLTENLKPGSVAAHPIVRQEPPSADEQAELPAAGTVRFEVREGLAIAMGDLILGTPDDPSTTSGSYEMPHVEYWKTPEIAYWIEDGFPDPERVTQALRHIQSKTGFQFVPFNGQPDGVVFRVGKKDCLSALGRQGGVQPIKLDSECGWNEITHEVMHTMGFIHEQSRSDRDKFVDILWPNIEEGSAGQFELLPEDFLGPVKDTPFDYRSIMLYDTTAFSKSGQPTIRSKTSESIQPSQSGLSPGDISRVKAFYSLQR